jgi:hypothetical protein
MLMLGTISKQLSNTYRRVGVAALTGVLTFLSLFPLSARQESPIKPPAGTSTPQGEPPKSPPATSAAPAPKPATSANSNDAPTIPIDQIIQKFAAREAEFKTERDNYTYTQTFSIETLDSSGRADGEYRMTSEVVFNPQGKRYEKVTFAPPPTLTRISLSQQDLDDLEHVQPFVLTTTELPKYDIKYVAHEPLDELSTYVFDVGPKTLELRDRQDGWKSCPGYPETRPGKCVPAIRDLSGKHRG